MAQLYYEAADGQILNLMSGGIYIQNPENLTQNVWKYTTISGVNGLARVKKFYKDIQIEKITLSIMAENEEHFNKIMYNMHQIFDKDVRMMTPGRIWWGKFYKEGFIFSTQNSDYDELFESVEHDAEFIVTYPYWIRKETFQYFSRSMGTGSLDYPRDFGYDYDQSELIEIIENECIGEANFELIFYGPAVNPTVAIGGRYYGLETELQEGEYAVINSITKKIRQYSITGQETNIFDKRNRDGDIFAKIPQGKTLIMRDRTQKMDITLYDERGEPVWI